MDARQVNPVPSTLSILPAATLFTQFTARLEFVTCRNQGRKWHQLARGWRWQPDGRAQSAMIPGKISWGRYDWRACNVWLLEVMPSRMMTNSARCSESWLRLRSHSGEASLM